MVISYEFVAILADRPSFLTFIVLAVAVYFPCDVAGCFVVAKYLPQFLYRVLLHRYSITYKKARLNGLS